MSRPWPIPRIKKTIHVVGDIQGVTKPYYGMRDEIVVADMARPAAPDVPVRVQVGDFVQGDDMGEYDDSAAFMDALGGAPWYATLGNHDYELVTPEEAVPLLRMPALNYSVDVGFCVVVSFFIPSWRTSHDDGLSPDFTWLASELALYEDRTVLLLSHPIFVGTIPGRENFEMTPLVDSQLKAVLDSTPQVKGYICGHTHNMITDPIIQAVNMGSRVVYQINGSALPVTAPSDANDHLDRLCSVYLTVEEDRLEARFRDHGAHQWVAGSKEQLRVWTMPFLD